MNDAVQGSPQTTKRARGIGSMNIARDGYRVFPHSARHLQYRQHRDQPRPNSTYYNTNIFAPLQLALATQGKQVTQNAVYSWRYMTKYDFQTGSLNVLSVGGAVRWVGRRTIGYLGADTPAGKPIQSLSGDKPAYLPSQYYFDFLTSYPFKLYQNRIAITIRLNVRNAFENGRIQAVGVNPDGSPFNYRIILPRQIILSANFGF